MDPLDILLEEIKEIVNNADNEEDLKIEFEKKLEKYFQTKPIDSKNVKKIPKAKHEVSLYKGRADAVYGAFVIEYKSPGTLITLNNQRSGIKELRTYFIGLTSRVKAKKITSEIEILNTSKVNGVIFDGNQIIFVKPKRGKDIESPLPEEKQKEISAYFPNLKKNELVKEFTDLNIDGPFEVNKTTMDFFLQNLKGLSFKIINVSNLVKSFGLSSDLGIRFINHLISKLKESKSNGDPKVKLLFDEWSRVQGIVYGKNIDKSEEIIKKIFTSLDLTKVTLKDILFCVHTYFALLIKFIVAEILTYQKGNVFSEQFSKNFYLQKKEDAYKRLELLENGKFYKDQGIKNFLEAIYLRWYLNVWDDNIFEFCRELSKSISEFQPISLYLEPELTRDVLKELYEDLIPKDIRHDLGEYYTPDWLAELTIRSSNLNINLNLKVLDPACGSGTFLIEIIKLKRLYAEKEEISKNNTLNGILTTTIGFDINPIAVLTARTNYLLAIASLNENQEIEIPVYLCDSIAVIDKLILQSSEEISEETEKKPREEITYKTSEGIFKIHKDLISKEIMEPLMENIEIFVKKKEEPETFLDILKANYNIPEKCYESIKNLYIQILILERQGKDGIWSKILKNLFIPYSLGEFDLIVGNPPWIQFEYLAEEYRESIDSLWDFYKLMIRDPKGERFGGAMAEGNNDFAILFSYVVTDQYLKNGGILSFVISQKVFNMRLGGAGFRYFNIPYKGGDIPLKVLEAHDLSSIKPFPGAANKTGMIVWLKNDKTNYPVKYILWQRKTSRKPLYTYYTLDEVFEIIEPINYIAKPLNSNDDLSPWQIAKDTDDFEIFNKMKGESDYQAQTGVHPAGASGVYLVELIREINTKCSRVRNVPGEGLDDSIPEFSEEVDHKLLHKVVLGRNIDKWIIKPELYMIIPHTEETDWRAIDEKTLKTNYTKTYLFLENFKEKLRNRPKYIKRRAGHPYYILLDIRKNTFSKVKVIIRRMGNKLIAAVSEDIVIPFETTTYISLNNLEEAYYLCGILNTSVVEKYVESYSPKGRSFGSPHIFKNVRIPKFDSNNIIHKNISRLSNKAHLIKSGNYDANVQEIEKKINNLVKKLFKSI